jgi:23S rRNA (uracil1939-C5)-methyltransferase
MLAKRAKRVYGIELEREAVDCADSLKIKNKLTNMTNICGYVEEKLAGVLEAEKGEKLRLILDPPRAGIARSVVKALIESGIEKLTIISCNPSTLARDLGLLTGSLVEKDGELLKSEEANGAYELVSVQPFDMFPQTRHVESIACLVRKADKK